ncbi:MAG TPA: PQQ-binding-like beta-propeller repeat protein [Candidatus Sulfotelmatobacter sp.]|nr:PQQ-binding-like beta-propeller repeat protein [Candidatus Sulfotelmatobacter sp.]
MPGQIPTDPQPSILPPASPAILRRIFLAAAILSTPFLISSCGKKDTAQKLQSGPHLKWSVRADGMAVSHPAVAPDGTIYISSNVGVQAYSPAGKQLWKLTLAAPGTPVIADDGTLYFACNYGLIFGVSSAGKLIWQPQIGLSGFRTPPALSSDASLFFVNSPSDIYAFRPRQSADVYWSLQTFREGFLESSAPLPGSARTDSHASGGTPVLLGDSTLIVARQSFLHSISTGGNRSWQLEFTPGVSLAAIGPDATIYVGDGRNVLYAIDPSGSTKWQFDGGGFLGSAVVDTAGVIYFTDGNALYAVNPDGTLKWRYSKQQQPHFITSPTLAADGTIYVGAEFGLLAFNPEGALKWNLRVYSPTSPLTIGPDGTIYFACGYSSLCAVEGDGAPLMRSSWPKAYHDLANTSRYSPLNE